MFCGAGNGNRTRAPGLGSPYSTIELYLQDIQLSICKINTTAARRQDMAVNCGAKFVNVRRLINAPCRKTRVLTLSRARYIIILSGQKTVFAYQN